MKRILVIILFLTLFLIYYSIINYLFIKFDYIHSNLIYYAEKALIALKGSPPRLENIGLIYPPFAFFPFLIINNPSIIVPLISSVITTFLILYYLKLDYNNPYRYILIILLCFNPIYLYLATQRFELLFYYILISISFLFSVLFLMKNYTLYAFIAGIVLGLTFYIDFRTIFILPFFIISLFFSIKEKSLYYRFSVIIVKLTPIVFFFLSWLYINYIFANDMFYFMKNPNSFFKLTRTNEFLVINFDLFLSLNKFISFLLNKFYILLPYFLIFPLILNSFKLHYSFPILVSFIAPLILIFTSIFHKISFPVYSDIILFLLFAIIFKPLVTQKINLIFLITFVITFILSFILPYNSSELNERYFIRTLVTFNSPPETLKYTEDIKVSEMIKKNQCKKILADDTSSFPVIYFHGIPKDFILPYNYEFVTYLSYPALSVDCLLINKKSEDIIRKKLSQPSSSLNEFDLIFDGNKYRLLKIKKSEDHLIQNN